MQSLSFIQWAGSLLYFLFIIAFGATVGSFINVVVYRLPRGESVITPPSACPSCGTHLTWRENFPIFGWICLGGKCRFCKSRISAEYVVVETAVSLLFGLIFALWFMNPSILTPMGIDVIFWKPEWAQGSLAKMWPMLLAVYALVGAFVCATMVDAKTFTIPLAIPWFATAVGFLVHPLHAAFYPAKVPGPQFPLFSPVHEWTIPVPSELLLGVAFGGAVGIAVALALLRFRVLPLSFADYDEWEKKQEQDLAQSPEPPEDEVSSDNPPLSLVFRRVFYLTAPALTLMFLGFVIGQTNGNPMPYMLIGVALGLLIGLPLRRLAEPKGQGEASLEPIWTHYPHARREMFKELLFLAPCIVLAVLGGWLTGSGGALNAFASNAPLWLSALGGSLLGYLVGGGSIWATRILGSLAFGKEAMGLGDVHLLAAAGAILGWIDPLLAFFTAPFLGITWAILSLMSSTMFKRAGTALPYGPHLALATLLVIVFKPGFEWGLTQIFNSPIDIP